MLKICLNGCGLSLYLILLLACTNCGRAREGRAKESGHATDEQLLDQVQKDVLYYFWELAEPHSFMARELYNVDGIYPENDKNVVATGGTGFGLLTLLVGIEREFIPRKEAVKRLHRIMDFLGTAERYEGAWSHWMEGETGRSIYFGGPSNGADIVETAFLAQGLICVREYFRNGNVSERSLAGKCDRLWRGINWEYYTNGEDVLYWWHPEPGEINFPLEGYNECLVAYVLAVSSPTYPIDPACYFKGWTRNGSFISDRQAYGIPLLLKHNYAEEKGGPLFWSHYSYLGLDPEGLSDPFVNYWDLNTNHVKINYSYCLENPCNFKGYSERYWGLTAGFSRKDSAGNDYQAHQPNNDHGVICPTAALSSFPYSPVESMAMLRYLYEEKKEFIGEAGPYDATSIHYDNWYAKKYLAIDQGTIAPMIENYRTGMLWNLFMNAPEISGGLRKLNFTSTKHDLSP